MQIIDLVVVDAHADVGVTGGKAHGAVALAVIVDAVEAAGINGGDLHVAVGVHNQVHHVKADGGVDGEDSVPGLPLFPQLDGALQGLFLGALVVRLQGHHQHLVVVINGHRGDQIPALVPLDAGDRVVIGIDALQLSFPAVLVAVEADLLAGVEVGGYRSHGQHGRRHDHRKNLFHLRNFLHLITSRNLAQAFWRPLAPVITVYYKL